MSDPTEIYLQPQCCADEYVGRLWCEHDAPVDCEDGVPWTKYVRADIAEADLAAARADAERYRAALRQVFFLEHNEREWETLEECQAYARRECAAIDGEKK